MCNLIAQVAVVVAPFDWLVVEVNLKVEWRSAMEEFGEQCVMMSGETKMLKSSAISWVTRMEMLCQVCIDYSTEVQFKFGILTGMWLDIQFTGPTLVGEVDPSSWIM